jgi:hypothetical protein
MEPKVWFRLARWAKAKNALTPKGRGFAYKVGKYLANSWTVSEPMIKWAEKIWREATDLGFSADQDD